MPYNGAGVFTAYTPGNPVAAGTTILASVFNNTITDIVTNGLTNTITKDGQTTTTAAIPFAAGITLTGTASNIATGANFISNGGTDAGLSFDASNNAILSVGLTVANSLTVTAGGATISAGSLTVTGGTVTTGAATALSLATSGGTQLQITNTASAVDNWTFTGGASASNAVTAASAGTDTNIDIQWQTKGSGSHRFFTNSASAVEQVRILHTATATRYITLTGSNGGNPTLSTSAGDLSLTTNLVVSTGSAITVKHDSSTVVVANAAGTAAGQISTVKGWTGSADNNLAVASSGIIKFYSNNSTTNIGQFTAGGYFKVSDNGAYQGAASSYHELRNSIDNTTVFIANSKTSAITSPLGRIRYDGYSPNTTTTAFLLCDDTTATRAEIRSNGGFANFQANDVNLCDQLVKNSFGPSDDHRDFVKALQYKKTAYKDTTEVDQVFDDLVAQDLELLDPTVVAVFSEAKAATNDAPAQPELKGSYSYRIQQRINSTIPRALTELDDLLVWKGKAEIALAAQGITIN